jgi:hypothetical protein
VGRGEERGLVCSRAGKQSIDAEVRWLRRQERDKEA